jgi:hypothetical protein
MTDVVGSFDLADFDIDQSPQNFIPKEVEPNTPVLDKDDDANG